jgi:glycosyltransferase involved in cell wall biosynthesis
MVSRKSDGYPAMTKFAIVSSYSESCGNASFTKVLCDSIRQYSNASVEVVELDLKLLQSTDKVIRQKADQHIDELSRRLKGFDGVNLQLEAGLYGTLPKDIVRRTAVLMRANPNTSLTLHSPRLMEVTPAGARAGIKKLLSLKIVSGLREIIGNKLADIHIQINRKIVRNAIKNNLRLIVHTERAQRQIQQFFDYDRIEVHPLKIIPDDFVRDDLVLQRIRSELSLATTDKLVGMFGYISAYKGHSDALKAIRCLPNDYKLLIFGRQHPQTLKADGKTDKYLHKLIETVAADKRLSNRVFFMGELEDDDFWKVASAIDVAWLPYYENGQDGSGIASICMDACRRVLCSSSFAFDELFKLVSYGNYMRFDIGNYLEMAGKTEMLMRRDLITNTGLSTARVYNLQSQALAYVRDVTDMEIDHKPRMELNFPQAAQ